MATDKALIIQWVNCPRRKTNVSLGFSSLISVTTWVPHEFGVLWENLWVLRRCLGI